MSDIDPAKYNIVSLHDRYAIERGEAERLIASFGCNRHELDRLLGSIDRTQPPREEVRRTA